MMSCDKRLVMIFPLVALALRLCVPNLEAAVTLPEPVELKWHYYRIHNTCRYAEQYVRHQVELFYERDKTIVPQLLRLLFSDCFVTGCDASILLDVPNSEKEAPQNSGLGAFLVIDKIKEVLEQRCPGVVSCADILNLATRDAVHMAGAPSYPVFTGRRDGLKSTKESVDIPSPSISWNESLAYFKSKGLDKLDMVTLLGGHCMGYTTCSYIVDRLYDYKNTEKPDPSMNTTILNQLRKQCPRGTQKGQSDQQVYLNPGSGPSLRFTESYYSRVKTHEAILGIDQQLLYGDDDTLQIIDEFAAGFEDFRKAFALSMSRMGSINVLTGKEGEIRKNCRCTNAVKNCKTN